jgi:ketosteroid isomerase-like protein
VSAPPPAAATREAPAPTPAPPPPSQPPPPPQPSDRELITATLNAYAAAYGRLDAAAVSRLHTTIDRERLADNFGQMRTQSVRITIGQVSISGTTATVSGTVYTRAEPKAGRAQESTVPTEFQLQKQNSGWVIVQRRTRQ